MGSKRPGHPVFIQSADYSVRRSGSSRALDIQWVRMNGEKIRSIDENWVFDIVLKKLGFSQIGLSTQIDDKLATIREEAREVMRTRLGRILYKGSPFADSVASSLEVKASNPHRTLMLSDPPIIFLKSTGNVFSLLTTTRNGSDKMFRNFRTQLSGFAKLTENIGFEIGDLKAGRRFAQDWVETRPTVRSVTRGKPRNDFEATLVRIMARLTGSFISNATVTFDDPSESHEHDLIVRLARDWVLNVELMDYRSVQMALKDDVTRPFKENWKSTILLRTMDKAARLDSQTYLVIMLRGFDYEIFQQMWKIGRDRGVVLLNDHLLEMKLGLLLEYASIAVMRNDSSLVGQILDAYNTQMKAFDSIDQLR